MLMAPDLLLLILEVYLGKYYLGYFCLFFYKRSIFNDFGKGFIVTDQTGEEALTGMIANISKVCYAFK